jgi:hypothetical protein
MRVLQSVGHAQTRQPVLLGEVDGELCLPGLLRQSRRR